MSRPRMVSMERVLGLHDEGLSQVAIGRTLNIHRTSVAYFLKLAGREMPQSATMRTRREEAAIALGQEREAARKQAIADRAERNHQMARMYMGEGLSSHKIGAHFGCSARNVVRILRMRPDVQMRWPRTPRPIRTDPPRNTAFLQSAHIDHMMNLASGRSR